MNLKNLSNKALLTKIETLTQDERRITTEILWHLHEIETRRLFAELGFSSLFEYCTTHLKYSAGSAQRRIASMRLLREMPEIASKINTGVLNVSALAQAQTLFRAARMENKAFNLLAKRRLVEKLEGKSSRECEKVIAEINPLPMRPSSERLVAANRTEIRFEADDALYEKLKNLQGVFAHSLKGSCDMKDLIALLANKALENENRKLAANSKKLLPASEVEVKPSETPRKEDGYSFAKLQTPSQNLKPLSRYISRDDQRAVREKAQNQCAYIASSGRRCQSRYALEFDHIKPFALGGASKVENLRLLCRAHNQLVAMQVFGQRKMQRYL